MTSKQRNKRWTPTRWLASTLVLGAAGAYAAVPTDAKAETALGIGLNYGEALDRDALDSDTSGVGLDLRVGPRLDLGILALTTELMAAYYGLGGPADVDVYRLMVGGRLAVGAIIRPNVFAHAGVGHLRFDRPLSRESATDFATDVGAGLDFTLLPLVDLGIAASYNWVNADGVSNEVDWVQLGLNVTFVIDG